jgi:putative peptidoglycan lipid II flippase
VSLFKSSVHVGVLTLLSRLLGFGRDLLTALILGTGMYADAFVVAFRIPNLLRSFFAEGALTSGFLPTFAHYVENKPEEAKSAFIDVSSFLFLVTGITSLLGIFFSRKLVSLFAPGFNSDTLEVCVWLNGIMLPYIMCVSFVALSNGALTTYGKFGINAWSQIVMNIVLIIGALCALAFPSQEQACYVLSATVLLGGIAQIIFQIPFLRGVGLRISYSRNIFSHAVRETMWLMVPAVFGGAVYQIIIFISTLIASGLQTGSIAWLFYADRLAQLPIGVVTMALSTVLLPMLSRSNASGDMNAFSKNLNASLRYTSFLLFPISAFLWVAALPLVRILFERGRFDFISSVQTAHALQAYTFGLWSMSCHSLLVRACLAKKKPHIPTLLSCFSLVLLVLVSCSLVGSFTSNTSLSYCLSVVQSFMPIRFELRHVGLALASSLVSLVNLFLLILFFEKVAEGVNWLPFIKSSVISFFCSMLAVLLINIFGISSELYSIIQGCVLFFLLYLALTRICGSSEAVELLKIFSRNT